MDLPPIVKTFVCTRLQDTMITSTDYTLCFSALVNMMISELRTSEFFFDNNDIKIKKVPGQVREYVGRQKDNQQTFEQSEDARHQSPETSTAEQSVYSRIMSFNIIFVIECTTPGFNCIISVNDPEYR
ncbi:hypothetical protein PHYBLDRAFT_151066 [Phycomyces blakesleeanus NRRL 1555(-)]|uniref:Uncharacterized protein n=1 Tax=Phycomyces blakesleeanus (strain ATCC 8743b / DSM 1359 / FGSC 10004 / NBRC 33097 / NRRL 1555) TaxID=763407 RepID=A0A162ZN40_PHYB8|nr:hypothetical protein PHYBLDRAFT_151066 [Phycomyces blakesleeanus NRRL 1555(-)]OAD67981.1 hypothetical protein PHYBLDRAFT_151066 [Phycomyces blakesleeanus NRRL 1555(-)]|eukprot:XP_018286021.1 hypothetical protein PHYBLDRAFT_151066 [Phycomyces blakesleeanus NRRL 1555(-)]